VGEVSVNDAPATAESTVFSGDRVRTGETGIATFTMSGMGTLKIAPQSQVRIAATYEYTAELESGTVVLHSIAGPHEMTLRMQGYVLIPSVREESTTSKIERAPDGSFLVSCLDGSVGVLTLIGSSGQFLRAGQSVRVFPKAENSGIRSPATTALGRELPHKKGWTILGLAGGGAIALELLQGGKHSPSPSVP
jgi:hypothetical protein